MPNGQGTLTLKDGSEVACHVPMVYPGSHRVEDEFALYLDRFERLLARADLLWTKPSEMTFYAALGFVPSHVGMKLYLGTSGASEGWSGPGPPTVA